MKNSNNHQVTILQRKLDLVRAEVYEELEKETANLLIKKTKSKISKLKRKLDFIESKKLSKAITVKPEDTDLRNNSVSKKRNRRFDKSLRTRRHKNKQNHSIHVIDEDNENVDTNIKLDPINLSNVPITEEQKQLLRKGPKFCPMAVEVHQISDVEYFIVDVRKAQEAGFLRDCLISIQDAAIAGPYSLKENR